MNKSTIHTEQAFEEAIETSLLENGGYVKGSPDAFDRTLAIDKNTVLKFLQSSQPTKWEKLKSIHTTTTEINVIARLAKELEQRGTLDVLRKGFTDYGVKFDMAFFKPENKLNEETEKQYKQNILTVIRQVKYSLKNENELDLVLFLNGLPVATVELKNQFTKQTVYNAKKQYSFDRDANELLFQFKKRALVHFVVDTDEVYMTTKLEGSKTKFLPFNKGYNNGAGNPPMNENGKQGYRTEYLWKEVWAKDSWLDIVGRFLHLQAEDIEISGTTRKKEAMIFPRYHQLDSVRKIANDVKQNGVGKNYLIQHSAGSGKSNSIAWLAYRLSGLHDNTDQPVFNAVIVVTDRRVLDTQLQNTIYQFDHKSGVVQRIDKDSQQLAEAIISGSPIVITTLQKFPFILEKVASAPKRKYAVIVDEAHSSQGGEGTKKMKEVLSSKTLEEAEKEEADRENEPDFENELRKSMQSRGKQANMSFFAFTATPKAKTIEVFGQKGKSGKPEPFHLYSMRQAIEEGFILDVLKHYTPYNLYFKLSKQIQDDPNLNKKKANRAIGRFVSLHPHNLAQKTEVIIEHFRQCVAHKIGGKAKAMVVTGSRLHAVRYKLEFDRYIREKNYLHIRVLIAFSGKVIDGFGNEFTESEMNGFREKELPNKFATNEYQILLVADKYQTGFDQPLLHTMYVDKKLSGVKAVQTLSRLNRVCVGKEDTFILDFVNDPQVILSSFQPYYELTALTETTDPNLLYDQKNKIEQAQVIRESDIDSFCQVYFKTKLNVKDQALLNSFIDPAVDRYKFLPKTKSKDTQSTDITQDDFKHALISFTRLYAYLSQIMPFQDAELEKLYTYSRFLVTKLPKENISERLKLEDEVALEYYRLQKVGEMSIALDKKGVYEINPAKEAGLRKDKDDTTALLSAIIHILNDKFGTDFQPADQLFFDQIEEEMVADENLSKQAQSNTIENFKYGFDDIFLSKVIERMEQNQDIFGKIMDDDEFAKVVKAYMLKKVYNRLNHPNQ